MSHPLPCLPTRPSSPAAPHHSLPQRVCGDGHNTLWALLRCETRCKLQSLIGQGSQVETGLIGVTEPGTAWHGQHLGRTQHSKAQFCAARMDAHQQTAQQPDSFPATQRKFLRLDSTQLTAHLHKYGLLSRENSTWKLCTKRNFKAQPRQWTQTQVQ